MTEFMEKFMPKNNSLSAGGNKIDWLLFFATLPLLGAGLITMKSFTDVGGGASGIFVKQIIWIIIALGIFFGFSFVDWRFLRRTPVIVTLFLISTLSLLGLFIIGHISRGAESWFRLGSLAIEPSGPAELILIILLAKYFSRRHVEIAHVRHIIVSGLYALIFFVLIFLQPDFGSAIIIFFLWFGMVLVSGISRKHLLVVFTVGLVAFGGLWFYGLKPYQKDRVENFLHPLTNISGSGYNAYQSTIAVGSGELIGKGIGYGTQSRLNFLPEYRTDFIFAAFAEEWGFVGVLLLFIMFALVIWRILSNATRGSTNFEILYGLGLAIYFMVHFLINVGMNIGILPVTGLVMPFMSYGGSHLITEFAGLGILMGMRRYRAPAHKDVIKNEFLGME